MKKRSLKTKVISLLMAFSVVVSGLPAGQLVTYAAPAVDISTTKTNVQVVQTYAENLLEANNDKDSYASGGFSWDSTNATSSWKYYNGMILDAYMMLGDKLNKETYSQFVKDFYDKGNLQTDGTPVNYVDKALESIPMGLALFDLLEVSVGEDESTPTDEEIEALKANPFTVADGLFDQSKISTDLGLSSYLNVANNVFTPDTSKFSNTFANGVVMTEFGGKLYCMWQSSALCEDTTDTRVAYSVSSDGGTTWSEVPAFLPNDGLTGGYCSSGGWHVDTVNNRLVAYINYWPSDLSPKGGYTYYTTTTDGINWSTPQPVLMEDGSQLNGVFEQDPHILEDGRIVNFAHFQQKDANGNSIGGVYLNPIYTDDKTGVAGWKKSSYTYLSQKDTSATQSRDLEPSMFVNEDGHLVMIARDQDSTYTVLSSVSTDRGETWSNVVQIEDMPDARQKQSAGNLPDGTAYIVSSPVNNKDRYPLVITLSADGKTFTKAYVLGSYSNSKLGDVKYKYQYTQADYENKVITDPSKVGTYEDNGAVSYKRKGYHYPKSVVIGDYLYISYSVNKEIVEYIKIPVNALSLNDGSEVNKNLITLTNVDDSNSDWELDYNLQNSDLLFVDRPKVSEGEPYGKFFNHDDYEKSDVIPSELIGSLYIRTAAEDKNSDQGTTVAKIKANQDVYLYLGLQQGKEFPSWYDSNRFTSVEKMNYIANDSLKYDFYKCELNTDSEYSFGGMKDLNYTWGYLAMVVPASLKYQGTINYIYNELTSSDFTKLNNRGGNYSELNVTEISLADVYMAQRFLIECAKAVNDNKLVLTDSNGSTVSASTIYSDVYTSLKWIGDNFYNSATKLFNDGYNISSGTVSGAYQAKEVGFYAMTLVDTINMLPSSMSIEKNRLKAILKNLFDGMLEYQDVDNTGMWASTITSGTDMNFEGSSMMSYALLKAYNDGILSDFKYGKSGLMAFNGIVASGMLDTVIASDSADTDEVKASGIAPLMMASTMAVGVIEDEIGVDDLSWTAVNVPNSNNKYCIATEMVPENKNGYVITRSGIPGTGESIVKFPLSLTESHNGLTQTTTKVSDFYNGDPYYSGILTNSTIEDEQLWLIDDFGYIYSKCSETNKYYLNANIDSGTLVLGINDSSPTEWVSSKFEGQTSRTYLYTMSDEKTYYVKHDGAKTENTPSGNFTLNGKNDVMLWTLETTPTFVAIDGQTLYSGLKGSTDISLDSIKANTKIYASSDKTADNLTEISWSDPNVEAVWDTNLDTNVAGTYNLSIKYYGTEIGKITVVIGDIDWVLVDDEYSIYERVQTMDTDTSNGGYILASRNDSIEQNVGTYYTIKSLAATTDGTYTTKDIVINTLSDDRYHISGVDSDNSWYMDINNYVYCDLAESDSHYYLSGSNGDDNAIDLTDSDNASAWYVHEFTPGSSLAKMSTASDYTAYFLNGHANRFEIMDSYNIGITIYEKVSTSTIRVAMEGKKSYSVGVGSSEISESSILSNLQLYIEESFSDGTTDLSTLNWSDSNISYSWDNKLDTSVAGVYTLTVKYDGVAVGEVVVNVGDLNWVDVTDNKYYRERTLEQGKTYVITDNIATGEVVSLGINSADNGYSSAMTVEVTDNGDSTYSISNVSPYNIWNYETDTLNLYGYCDYTKYYLNDYNTSKGQARVLNNKYYKDIDWYVSNTYDDGSVQLKAVSQSTTDGVTVENTNYLAYNGSYYYITADSTDTNTQVMLYSKTTTGTEEVAMEGETEYKVLVGTASVSETSIKADTSLFYRKDGEISELDWSDPNIVVTWDKSLDTNAIGEYNMTVTYKGNSLGIIKVSVVEITSYWISDSYWVGTGIGTEPDLSNVKLTVNYSDGTTEILTIEDGLTVIGYNVDEAGTYNADIYYNGIDRGDITIYVSENPYFGLSQAESYPEHPEAGAVRIFKDATNEEFDWYDTGVTKVELDVAGISVKKGVDVILVTDISNSMGRWYKDSNGNDLKDQPGQKLKEAMDAANQLTTILLGNGNPNDNSVSFVTFGGYDDDNTSLAEDKRKLDDGTKYLDATQTVFVYEQILSKAQTAFNGTKFISYSAPTDIVQITDNEGKVDTGYNHGGTNYDYAFAEAMNAVTELKTAYSNANDNKSYDESGRQIILLFMTDGAPTYYNYEIVNNINGSSNYIYGTKLQYPATKSIFYPSGTNGENNAKIGDKDTDKNTVVTLGGVTKTNEGWWTERSNNWFNFTSTPNKYAVQLSKMVDEFYSVGFKLSEDAGTSKHCYNWEPEQFESLLQGVAGNDYLGKSYVNDVILAEDAVALSEAYAEIANQLTYSGTHGKVYDEVKDVFTVKLGETITDLDGNSVDVAPVIQVKTYELYSSADTTDSTLIGTRKGGEGTENVLETVSFKEVVTNGKTTYEAYSSVIGSNTNILTYESDTKFVINAEYFDYTYDNGWEYFNWYINQIEDVEYAFSYYAYLEGTNPTIDPDANNAAWRNDGIYDTNQSATLEYVDINGDYAQKTFRVPQRPWGEAATTVEYYLVNENGQPVNRIGEVIPFANRIKVGETKAFPVNWEESLEVKGYDYLPDGYEMHSPQAGYTVSVESQNAGTLIISDPNTATNTSSTVWINQGSSWEDDDGNEYYDVSSTMVAFGVIAPSDLTVDEANRLGVDRIVIDYGKAIQENVFDNNPNINFNTEKGKYTTYQDLYTAEVVGFYKYSSEAKYVENVQSSKGDDYFDGQYGRFTIVDGGTVQYTPSKMVSSVERVFTVVKFTEVANTANYYYLYQEFDVIPATNVYYETDFAPNVFTTVVDSSANPVATWGSKNNTTITDYIQDDGSVSSDKLAAKISDEIYSQVYGFDSTYKDDAQLSDESSIFVEGLGPNKTTAKFTFTGTGFDIISVTGETQGMIRVNVYNEGTTTNPVKRMSVLNKHESVENDFYQIPVISIENLPHGNYDVVIEVFASAKYTGVLEALSRDNDFYFDAIRIYNPVDVSETTYYEFSNPKGYIDDDTTTTDVVEYLEVDKCTDDIIALCAYIEDGEAYPSIKEVRDILISAPADSDQDSEGGDYDISDKYNTEGVLYIERNAADEGTTSSHNHSIGFYEAIGPNNEVYLSKGQAIVFEVANLDLSKVASIDIGAKSIDGSTVKMHAVISNSKSLEDAFNAEKGYKQLTPTISSCTSQYYELYDGNSSVDEFVSGTSAYVYITNVSETDAVLSITDIKVAHKVAELSSVAAYSLVLTDSLIGFADECAELENDYEIKSEEFTDNKVRIFGNGELVVETSQFVKEIQITNRFGKSADAEISYVDTNDGVRIWKAKILMSTIGKQQYKITGYGTDGTNGTTTIAEVEVTKNAEGGWQDAKSIYKTLFNCRILSIKRGNSNKLYSESR